MTPLPRAAVESPLLGPGQPFSPRVPVAQGEREGRFLDFFVPQNHLVAIDFEAVKRPVSGISSGRRGAKAGNQRHVSLGGNRGILLGPEPFCQGLNKPILNSAEILRRHGQFGLVAAQKAQKRSNSRRFYRQRFPDKGQ